MTIRKNGMTLYPVAKFSRIQHIFFNYNDRCYNDMIEREYSGNTVERFDESERLLDIVNNNVSGGMVYAPYADYRIMKDIIGAYVARHNGSYCD